MIEHGTLLAILVSWIASTVMRNFPLNGKEMLAKTEIILNRDRTIASAGRAGVFPWKYKLRDFTPISGSS
jgi:hypothetical protein